MKKGIIIFFLLSLFHGTFAQTTYYISVTGDNNNTGLMANDAFETINHAINLSNCGDSIYVLTGTYHEKVSSYKICPENNRITIQGDVVSRPLIIGDSTASNKYAIGASGAGFRFRHLELTSPYPNVCDPSNMVVVGKGDYFDFIDVVVHHSGYDGIKTTSDCNTNDFPIGWRIIDSEIHSNGLGCPASVVNGDGIDFTECRNCLIDNSIIRDNKGHQLQIKLEARNVTVQNSHIEGMNMIQIGLKGGTPQCDPNALNADSVYFRRNVIIAKGDTSEFVFKLSDVSNLVIENNTIIKDSIDFANVGFICFGGCTGSTSWSFTPQSPVLIRNNIFANMSNTPFFAGPDTTYFDPFGIVAAEVTADYNLFYDIQGGYSVPVDGGANSIIGNPLFCDYPQNLALSNASPAQNAGDPSGPIDPDNSINDIGAIWHQINCFVGQEENSQFDVSVYPNPSRDRIKVQVSGEAKLILYNSLGVQMNMPRVFFDEIEFDVSSYAKGMYVLKIERGDNIQVRKVLKN